jgi:hypothetical protein
MYDFYVSVLIFKFNDEFFWAIAVLGQGRSHYKVSLRKGFCRLEFALVMRIGFWSKRNGPDSMSLQI